MNWCGFYFVRLVNEHGAKMLVLGPFQGKKACTRIASGNGVCGTSWSKKESIRVDDVHEFPGHIACDEASSSELVVPILAGDEVRVS